MKRKQFESASQEQSSPKKWRRTTDEANGDEHTSKGSIEAHENGISKTSGSQKVSQTTPKSSNSRAALRTNSPARHDEDESASPTPKPHGIVPFETPRKTKGSAAKMRKEDQSAKRKSARAILEQLEEDDWENENVLAREILDEGTEVADMDNVSDGGDDIPVATVESSGAAEDETPSKRGRGRPKGSKNKRTPTPEGDLPPEERYFFQNRAGPPQVSGNTLASLKLLTHDEYFEKMRLYEEDHLSEKTHLARLHARSFPQWRLELNQGFSVCLHGWGSKTHLTNKFAGWLHTKSKPLPKIVVVNGYAPKLNIRNVLSIVASAAMEDAPPSRLVGQPHEILDTILAHLSTKPPIRPVLIILNSLDAPPLRKYSTQQILARLATHASIQLMATVDTPSVSIMWNSSLHDHFGFVFHDCTTFAAYDAELNVVDDVHELLGRKGRRIGGKEGIGFVLKSLPENARNLYRVLLTEVLAVLSDGLDGTVVEEIDGQKAWSKKKPQDIEEVGIEYRALYQKASEEFICSSDMNFRFLLKEFHDHQMITSQRDISGTELLGVPLAKEEMEGVLEDLVLG